MSVLSNGYVLHDGVTIDAIKINGIRIIHIQNPQELTMRRGVTLTYGKPLFQTESGFSFEKIFIKEKGFKLESAGNQAVNVGLCLSINVNRDDGYANLNGWTLDELKERIHSICVCLEEEYGVYITLQDSFVRECELCVTYPTAQPFAAYQHAITEVLTKSFECVRRGRWDVVWHTGKNRYKEELNGIAVLPAEYGEHIEIKCYDKRQELEKVHHLNLDFTDAITRFEIKLDKEKFSEYVDFENIMDVPSHAFITAAYRYVVQDIASDWQRHCMEEQSYFRDVLENAYERDPHTYPYVAYAQFIRDGNDRKVINLEDVYHALKGCSFVQINGHYDCHAYQREKKKLERVQQKFDYGIQCLIRIDDPRNQFLRRIQK